MNDTLRPSDDAAFLQALRAVRRQTGVPVAFGGHVRDGVLRLSQVLGARTDSLVDLAVLRGNGLGGQVIDRLSPGAVDDYGSDRSITHDYDDAVLEEGIRSVAAAPVTVEGRVRGVLYAAARAAPPLGERATGALMHASRLLAGELRVRDEVDRRLRLLGSVLSEDAAQRRAGASLETLRDVHRELRGIAAEVDDPDLRERLRGLSARLAGGPAARRRASALAARELDVLVEVARGCSNADAAQRLSLRPETVKAYLRSAMAKLDVHNRHEAVVAARRQGLLP